jgi:hypothetical protein
MITIPAEIKPVKQMADGSLTIPISTQELPAEEMAAIFKMAKFCYVSFKPESFTAGELKELDNMKSDATFGRSLSKRLRDVLYVVYKKSNIDESFENYYSRRMNELIERTKEEIND